MNRKGIKVKQRDLKDCGPACISSLSAYYKTYLPVSRLREMAGTDLKGTTALGIIEAFGKIGMTAKGIKCNDDSLHHIPVPSIAHLKLKNNFHHYVVIYNVARTHLHIMDPATGKIEKVSRNYFKSVWTGILIIAAPGNDYQPEGVIIKNSKRFLYLLKPHKSTIFQALLGAAVYTLLGFSTSVYIQKLTDYIIVFQLKQALQVAGFIMIFIILCQLVLSVIKNKMILKTGQLIDARLVLGYYRHLLKLPQTFFDTMRVGEIISRINDAAKIRQFLSDTSINIVLNVMILLFSITIIFIFHWKLALLVSLLLPVYALVYFITNSLNKKQERLLMEKSAELESQLVESLQNIKTIKQLNLEQEMNIQVEWRFIDLLNSVYRSGINSIFSSSSSELINRIFTLLLLWTGTLMIFKSELTVGQLLSFYTILGYMSGPAASLVGINKIYQNANIAADRLFEILEMGNERNPGIISHRNTENQGIIFRNVDFAYNRRKKILNDFNLQIAGGKITAITGESGSGKSTISSLITGLYEPGNGSIFIGDHPVNQYKPEFLRNLIAVIPQQTDLFSGSILYNIAPGITHPDQEKAFELCKRLGLYDLIHSLPEGLNTMIGDKGYSLSGGESQRISIARALYRNPSILIFDEATSSLDSEAEQKVKNIILQLKKENKTILLISHKPSFYSIADIHIQLFNGQIVSGHNKLRETNSIKKTKD